MMRTVLVGLRGVTRACQGPAASRSILVQLQPSLCTPALVRQVSSIELKEYMSKHEISVSDPRAPPRFSPSSRAGCRTT